MFTFQLDEQEVQFLVQQLSQLPTSTGAYPLLVKVAGAYRAQKAQSQGEAQIIPITPNTENNESESNDEENDQA